MQRRILLAVTATAVMSAGLFVSCKKDSESPLLGKHNVLGDDLKALEFYTPDELTMEDKLLSFTNYMNEPEAYSMPNMEIKEAIWFAEAFFNIGVCAKQERGVKVANMRKTYSMTIPFTGEWGGNEAIRLNGEVLKVRYRNMLNAIITEICGEYALNFGDLYVSDVNVGAKTLTLCLEVLYGPPTDITELTLPGYLKIIGPNMSPVIYPGDPSLDFFDYNVDDMTTTDIAMTATLNQEREPFLYAVGIVNVKEDNNKLKLTKIGDNPINLPFTTYCYQKNNVSPGGVVSFDGMNCNHLNYAENCQSCIYGYNVANGGTPIVNGIPAGYQPLWAFCDFMYYQPKNLAHHRYGIETICMFLTSKAYFNSIYAYTACY